MARYIDADAFLKNEIKRCGCVPLVGSCTTDNESLAYQLAKAPTADIAEIVRCNECLYSADNGGDCDRVLIHTHRNLVTELNEYEYFKLNCCEYGKRKEGAQQ